MSKRFRIQDVEPGMVLAFPAINPAGRVVLGEGTILNEKLINRLQNWHIVAVDIVDGGNFIIPPVEDVPIVPAALFERPAISKIHKNFCDAYKDNIKECAQVFEQVRYMKVVPMMKMRELADKSLRGLSLIPGAVNLLYMLAKEDERLIHHSLNVAVIAGSLGRWLGLSAQALHNLTLAAILHDIGKTQFPQELANKKLIQLTPEEVKIMKNHTIEGYQLLKRNAYHLPFCVLAGVLQHHEYADGRGYPLQLNAEKTHLFAQIILVADMYETLTSKELTVSINPFSALEIIYTQSFKRINPTVSTVFLNNIRNQFIGNIVRLNDGQEAIVVALGQDISQQPVIQTRMGKFINLELVRDLKIEEVIQI